MGAMKRSKTWKWRIGAVGMTGIALLFQQVKASPAFSAAVEKSKAQNVPAADAVPAQDKVMEEWRGQMQQDTGRELSPTGRVRGHRAFGSEAGGSGGVDPQLQEPADSQQRYDGSSSVSPRRTRSRHS